ncbi:MAG: RNase H1/viroplasmin domain-containing protein, partial [Muribaculaceae bacterium]|nr:RNase H1/viroplasmin domain-containing protein [Muribaculaceae bacterium]
MSKRKKWYVVWSGNETGLFDNWADCEDQVKGVPGARYKAYNT